MNLGSRVQKRIRVSSLG